MIVYTRDEGRFYGLESSSYVTRDLMYDVFDAKYNLDSDVYCVDDRETASFACIYAYLTYQNEQELWADFDGILELQPRTTVQKYAAMASKQNKSIPKNMPFMAFKWACSPIKINNRTENIFYIKAPMYDSFNISEARSVKKLIEQDMYNHVSTFSPTQEFYFTDILRSDGYITKTEDRETFTWFYFPSDEVIEKTKNLSEKIADALECVYQYETEIGMNSDDRVVDKSDSSGVIKPRKSLRYKSLLSDSFQLYAQSCASFLSKTQGLAVLNQEKMTNRIETALYKQLLDDKSKLNETTKDLYSRYDDPDSHFDSFVFRLIWKTNVIDSEPLYNLNTIIKEYVAQLSDEVIKARLDPLEITDLSCAESLEAVQQEALKLGLKFRNPTLENKYYDAVQEVERIFYD